MPGAPLEARRRAAVPGEAGYEEVVNAAAEEEAADEEVEEGMQALRLAEDSWRAARELVGCSGGICEAQGALDVAALALEKAREAHSQSTAANGAREAHASFPQFVVSLRAMLESVEV